MNIIVEIRDKAIEEMDLSHGYYEEKRTGLGNEFVEEVFETIEYIQKFPLHFHVFDKQYRQARINRFPFLIVYEFVKENNTVVIISVFHGNRNPENKFEDE